MRMVVILTNVIFLILYHEICKVCIAHWINTLQRTQHHITKSYTGFKKPFKMKRDQWLFRLTTWNIHWCFRFLVETTFTCYLVLPVIYYHLLSSLKVISKNVHRHWKKLLHASSFSNYMFIWGLTFFMEFNFWKRQKIKCRSR